MIDFDVQIWEVLVKNIQFLCVLGDIDYVKFVFEEQLCFIYDLDSEFVNLNCCIQVFDNMCKLEFKDYEKYCDSNVCCFMYKVMGQKEKFFQKVEKEECEYFEVLQKEY